MASAAEGSCDSHQASQQRSQRRPVPGFEPGTVFGTKVETIKFLCFKVLRRMK